MFYNCEKTVLIPPKSFIKYNCADGFKETVGVDKCLANEIKRLWSLGVRTTGCCCGHGKFLGFIQVANDDIQKMIDLGYQNYIFDDEVGGCERKDGFIPKTTHHIIDVNRKYSNCLYG